MYSVSDFDLLKKTNCLMVARRMHAFSYCVIKMDEWNSCWTLHTHIHLHQGLIKCFRNNSVRADVYESNC